MNSGFRNVSQRDTQETVFYILFYILYEGIKIA